MPKAIYCSKCGIQLDQRHKAVPGKGYIVDCVDPHNCEGYAVKSNEEGKPTVLDILDSLKDMKKPGPPPTQRSLRSTPDLRDRRADKDIVTSTAPQGILNAVKSGDPTEPNGGAEGIDSEMEG